MRKRILFDPFFGRFLLNQSTVCFAHCALAQGGQAMNPLFWIRKSFHSFFSYYVQKEFVDYIRQNLLTTLGLVRTRYY